MGAEEEKVAIHNHDQLLKLRADIESVLAAKLPANKEERVLGTAEIKQVITLNGASRTTFNVAGCKVITGKLRRKSKYQILRNGTVIHVADGLRRLRHFKDEVHEIEQGSECALDLNDDYV